MIFSSNVVVLKLKDKKNITTICILSEKNKICETFIIEKLYKQLNITF